MNSQTDVERRAVAAVPFVTNSSGQVLIDRAQYYTTVAGDGWAYMQDLALLSQGKAGRFNVDLSGISPETAEKLLANATATVEGQLLATGPEGARGLLESMTAFVESGGSLEGLEGPFLSAGVSLLGEPDAADLLDRAASALEHAGGVRGVVGALEHLAAGRLSADDILPILDAASGQMGLPAVSDIVHAIEAAALILEHPEAILEHPGDAAIAVLHEVKGPGHRVFSSVSSTLGMISPAARAAFRDFRHSDVGQFVETVASVALGIGMLIGAPVALGIKAGVHVVEGAVALFTGIFDALFGDDDWRERDSGDDRDSGTDDDRQDSDRGAGDRRERDRGRGGHTPTQQERDKLKTGQHALVGCWVEEPEAIPDGPIRLRTEDGSCPDPDLSVEVPVPLPGTEGAWPSTPQPYASGDGLFALFGDNTGDEPLQFHFDADAGFGLDQVVATLGWDETAEADLASELEALGQLNHGELQSLLAEFDDIDRLSIQRDGELVDATPSVVIADTNGADAIAVAVIRGKAETAYIVCTPMETLNVTDVSRPDAAAKSHSEEFASIPPARRSSTSPPRRRRTHTASQCSGLAIRAGR